MKPLPTLRALVNDRDEVAARDGIVLCFFMHRSHGAVAHAVWRALQTYRRAIPPHALDWYPDDNGDYQTLDAKGWGRAQERLLDRCWPYRCSVELNEYCDAASTYNFEYHGAWLDTAGVYNNEDPTCAVSFTLPTEYLMEHGPAHVRSLALELARELPLSFGYASFALVANSGQWFAGRRAVLELRDRYTGLDIYKLGETASRIGTRARGAYWLTFLGYPLLGRLGGSEHLRRLLPFPDVSRQALPPLEGERVLLTLGEGPEAIDTLNQERPSPSLVALARLLERFLHEEERNWFRIFGDPEEMRRWTRRLCP